MIYIYGFLVGVVALAVVVGVVYGLWWVGRKLVDDGDGVTTAPEYAMIAAGTIIAVALIVICIAKLGMWILSLVRG